MLYPGRPAPGHGPDFRDAILELDGQRIVGPVELHRTPAEWHAHGHDADSDYDNVVLHVVSSAEETGLAGRKRDMPTLTLKNEPDAASRTRNSPSSPLAGLAALGLQALQHRLRRAGSERFDQRVSRMGEAISSHGIEQALYNALMEGLGYAENRGPFMELAGRLPVVLMRAASLTVPDRRRTEVLRGLLLSGAGLQPVTAAWTELVGLAPMDAASWHASGVRPSNHPRHRMTAAASYLATATPTGLAAWLDDAARDGAKPLVRRLLVPSGEGTTAPVGEARARELAVNAVLPALAAHAKLRGDTRGFGQLKSTYVGFPSLPDNTITREAAKLLGEHAKGLTGACAQQGLMHLYRRAVAG